MKNTEFVLTLADLCKVNTCYATGAFGAVVDLYNNRKRYIDNTSNKNVKMAIEKAPDGTFLFDCVNLGKGILWGFDFDKTLRYGGSAYKSAGVPDFGVKSVKKYGVASSDFGHIEVGEWLVNETEDHVGYYIGGNMFIDISQSNKDYKVMVHNMSDRKWAYHVKMNFIDYEPEFVEMECPHCGKKIKVVLTK